MSSSYFDEVGDPLSEEETAKMVDDIAAAIVKRGLVAPAVMFLEMNKPLTSIAGQGLIVATPLIAPLLGTERMSRYTRFLRSPENVERLIQRIEDMSEEKELKAKEEKQQTAKP